MKRGSFVLTLCVMAAILSGCRDNGAGSVSELEEEVEKLQKEVSQLKSDVRELRQRLFNREMPRNPSHNMIRTNGVSGVSRMGGGRPAMSREEIEARRRAMQDPEMRKKLEAEHRARMEERRRRHEERRKEFEERRKTRTAPAVPSAQN